MEKLWTKPFILLTISLFFLYTGFYFLLPVLPIHFENVGAQQWQIGIIIGLFTLSSVIARLFVGEWLDRYGRKVYIVLGIIFFAFFTFSYSLITVIPFLIVVRIIHGMSWGVANTALGTAITDCIPSSKLGQGMGWYGLAMTLAMAIGPLLGNYMLGRYSIIVVFICAAMITILPIIIVYKLKFKRMTKTVTLIPISWSKALVLNLIVIGCLTFSFGGITTYVPLYMAEHPSNVSSFFVVYAISLSLCRPIAGKWIDRKGEQGVIVVSLVLVMVALIQLSTLSGTLGILLSASLYGIGFGMAQPALQTSILRMLSFKRAGSANAVFFTAFDIGIGSGAILLGVCASIWTYSTLFMICGAVSFVGLLLYIFILCLNKKSYSTI